MYSASPFGNLLFCKNYIEIECVPPGYDIMHFTQARQGWPVAVSGGSRVTPSLAALAWDQIAAQLAFFENEMKCIGINIGQSEDEKRQAKDEKAR